ncbi:hypothetical protein [Defluviimonas salinarum]|uniref:Uncharacterized protein n=1 Tax=Defluviimonas salinarum TaxID=2992147 RepID=A0ABT3IZK8_9RHOB|nr:hypothetical protein [Defluviimonas salinarum]MCW3780868.1 hypothetical protein [Defluviimonas salinarum]
MVAYVTPAPVANVLLGGLPRRGLLRTHDLVHALVFVLQPASVAFTPTFHATIPDILPDERRYAHALKLSRLTMNLENIASPALADLEPPRLLYRTPERKVMLTSGSALGLALPVGTAILALTPGSEAEFWPICLGWMTTTGLASSTILTPTGRLLRRSAGASKRPALFAAQFAL